MGHLEASGRKFTSAVGALDRSAGIAVASGAELVVFHPGFLLGREREDAIDAVVEQLGTLRERLVGNSRRWLERNASTRAWCAQVADALAGPRRP